MSAGLNSHGVESVGASGAIFGVVATFIGIIVVNWMDLKKAPMVRCMLICSVVMVILINVLFSFSMAGAKNSSGNAQTDNYAHLGGFLSGLFTSFIILKPKLSAKRGKYEKIVQ